MSACNHNNPLGTLCEQCVGANFDHLRAKLAEAEAERDRLQAWVEDLKAKARDWIEVFDAATVGRDVYRDRWLAVQAERDAAVDLMRRAESQRDDVRKMLTDLWVAVDGVHPLCAQSALCGVCVALDRTRLHTNAPDEVTP